MAEFLPTATSQNDIIIAFILLYSTCWKFPTGLVNQDTYIVNTHIFFAEKIGQSIKTTSLKQLKILIKYS